MTTSNLKPDDIHDYTNLWHNVTPHNPSLKEVEQQLCCCLIGASFKQIGLLLIELNN